MRRGRVTGSFEREREREREEKINFDIIKYDIVSTQTYKQ